MYWRRRPSCFCIMVDRFASRERLFSGAFRAGRFGCQLLVGWIGFCSGRFPSRLSRLWPIAHTPDTPPRYATPRPWQFLYFLPLPQGHGSLRPTLGWACTGAGLLFSAVLALRAASTAREV